ncbi:MAG: uracil-DNA glycosylase [Nitrososphaerota archaeon]|nr:uracil-DNA glycosylase [Nitrososphaerota archaeon]MDG6930087.1 uracil-DNA glycosylase [Nitrososphaerota archaeon]
MGTNPVLGEGPADSKIMIVGEAPGANEEKVGRPFVGRGGKLLRKTLEKFEIKNPYITNVVKHRPPENRKPKKEEIIACSDFLECEINAVKPHVILALGKTAAEYFGIKSRLSEVNGKIFEIKGIKVVACYHPAAVLRNTNLTDEFNQAIGQAKMAL